MKRRSILHLLAVLLVLTPGIEASAQDDKPQAAPVLGFEELFTAGTLLESSKEFQAAQEEGATLTQKRTALESKPVTEALRLLRVWLNKQGNTVKAGVLVDAPFANLRQFRQLGRALGIEQYVSLANGRVGDAIDSARDGLRFSHVLKPNQYVVWLYSSAIDSNMAISMGRHIEQFSHRDADRLTALAKDWLSTPDLAEVTLEVERNVVLRNYRKQKEQREQEAENAGGTPDDEPDKAVPPELAKLSTAEIKEAQERIPVHLNALFARLQMELKKPYWEVETPAAPPTPKTVSERLAEPFVQMLEATTRSLLMARARQQAYARLLACHAAILRHRWEHDRLPATLEELKLGDTAVDPFSGKMFLYKVEDRKYTLESIGPMGRGSDNTQQRVPLSLTPPPRNQ
jgi:hypothetical protein